AYPNTGIIFRVVPRINSNANIVLDIEQEISNVTTPGSLTPTVSQRRVKSSIAVATGQTVLLAGLISETRNRGRQGIPFLDKLPLLDEALSSNRNTVQRTELIIFIRPQIIRDSVDAQYVAEQLRSSSRASRAWRHRRGWAHRRRDSKGGVALPLTLRGAPPLTRQQVV